MEGVIVTGLSKSFEGTMVFSGIDLEIPKARVTAILGPSGRGKTTLLRILCGLERQDEGLIEIPQGMDVAIAFQEPRLLPWLTVRQNLSYCLGSSRMEDAISNLRHFGLEGLEERLPSQLSGGQQQRVNLVRAISSRAGLLLLDEPFNAIGLGMKAGLLPDLRKGLLSEGRTVVMVTHSPMDVALMADLFYLMDEAGSGARGPYEVQCGSGDRRLSDDAMGKEIHRLMLLMASLMEGESGEDGRS